jgi:signal transduction histidine kinase
MNTLTVLLVDDDDHVLNSICRVLRGEDYRLITASDGMNALEILDRESVHVVLSDIGMKSMDGLTLLREVANRHPTTIRLVISGISDSETILNAINSGSIYRYITKPWNDDELKILIHQALELYRLNDDKSRLLQTLQETNRTLEQKVAFQALQLMDTLGMAMIGKYTAEIVHNLNNALAGMSGLFVLMKEELADESSNREELFEICADGILCTKKMHEIISGILNRARSRDLFSSRKIDINVIVREEDRFFCFDHIYKYEIERKLILKNDLPTLAADSSQIKQILDNLIKNAIDAMERTETKKLIISTDVDDESILISITDTGEGIEADALQRIFDTAYTTKPVGKGTGLGLASVKYMVESFGGNIQVSSTRGRGTTFTVSLPVNGPSLSPQESGVFSDEDTVDI